MNAKQTNADITALLRARNTLLWITSREEQRVERALLEAAGAAKYQVRYWDCATGITDSKGEPVERNSDPAGALAWLRGRKERIVLVMRDLHKWFDPIILRTLRSLARELQGAIPGEARAIVLLTPSSEVPLELCNASVIDYPLPDREDVAAILDFVVGSLSDAVREKVRAALDADPSRRDAAIDAALGLTAEEIGNCYSRSLVTTKDIDPALVSSEKRRVIARERVLTWYDPDPRGLDAVGGLDVLKGWLRARRVAFTPAAREYGLPAPKGAFLLGITGCGKSLTAKAVASAWGMPLLRIDMGALKSKFVGESEQNLRRALQVAETVSPCVLWFDEIEKSLAGAVGPAGDGGVSADALGTVLSWMQERKSPVFVIATANDVRGLPPEFLRKGRFDELFWIDLPTARERADIMAASLRERGRGPDLVDLAEVAKFTEGFTGSEISALVPDALFTAFADDQRDVTTEDLRAAALSVVPIAKTTREKLDNLREWSKGRARYASTPEDVASGDTRTLDL